MLSDMISFDKLKSLNKFNERIHSFDVITDILDWQQATFFPSQIKIETNIHKTWFSEYRRLSFNRTVGTSSHE